MAPKKTIEKAVESSIDIPTNVVETTTSSEKEPTKSDENNENVEALKSIDTLPKEEVKPFPAPIVERMVTSLNVELELSVQIQKHKAIHLASHKEGSSLKRLEITFSPDYRSIIFKSEAEVKPDEN